LDFIENIFNDLTRSESLRDQWDSNNPVFKVKFSFLRVMSKMWGENVVRPLFKQFKMTISTILDDFEEICTKLADNFDKEKSRLGFDGKLKNKYSINELDYNILRQALLCILDMSINEFNIKMVNNSLLSVETFYLKIENCIIDITKNFMKKLFNKYSVRVFIEVSQHFRNVL
jgi:hypothetical protein